MNYQKFINDNFEPSPDFSIEIFKLTKYLKKTCPNDHLKVLTEMKQSANVHLHGYKPKNNELLKQCKPTSDNKAETIVSSVVTSIMSPRGNTQPSKTVQELEYTVQKQKEMLSAMNAIVEESKQYKNALDDMKDINIALNDRNIMLEDEKEEYQKKIKTMEEYIEMA
jgi:hypothetical protein